MSVIILSVIMLSVTMLSVIRLLVVLLCHDAVFHLCECNNVTCYFDKYNYAKCHYAESRGARGPWFVLIVNLLLVVKLLQQTNPEMSQSKLFKAFGQNVKNLCHFNK